MKTRRFLYIVVVFCFSIPAYGQSENRAEIQNKIMSLRSDLNSLEKEFLSATPADKEAFSDFLGQPHTGLIRLLPREVFDKPEKLTIRGGGAYYSFTRLTHAYGVGSDIELSRDEFSVGFAGADYGFIGMIDGELQTITLEHPGVRYLAALKAAVKEPDAKAEQRRR